MMRDPSRYYRRQMRRQFRRGGFPVMFLDPREPLTLIAIAALGRWVYRHRSAFLPFIVTGSAFVVAAKLHQEHRSWWPLIAALTFLVAFLLGIPHRILWERPGGKITANLLAKAWEACGIGRPAERAYITTIVGVTGEWVAAAAAFGPATRPLPQIALWATVVLGIPWWAHRRRRARVRVTRTVQAWPGLAENMGLPGSKLTRAVVDAWGWTGRVKLRKGTSAEYAITRIPNIESALGIRPGSVRILPDPSKADRFLLRVIEKDPHAQPVPWPGARIKSITQPIELGLFEDGRPVTISVLRRNMLVGGMMGAGKSGVVNVILAALAACRDVEIWGIDLKGGMELKPWEKCLRKLATTPEEASALFRDAITELNRRARLMAAHGLRVWEPTPEMPEIILVVDEYAELPAEAREYADSLARRGRAVAVNMIAATQRPTQEAMGNNAVRSQMDIRICLRVKERRDVDLILGQGSFTSGWHAHELTLPGTFLISAPEHHYPERARAYLITDDQVKTHAARHTRAVGGADAPLAAPGTPHSAPAPPTHAEGRAGPSGPLWDALRAAGPDGVTVAELLSVTGLSRPTLYRRLQAWSQAGHVIQTSRGSWRAARPPTGPAGGPGDGRPPPWPGEPRRPPRGPRPRPSRPPNP